MIRIHNLTKNYQDHKVLNSINLEVKKGEVYGFIGHNGSGKSTTMNILAGLIKFQDGECFVNEKMKAVLLHRYELVVNLWVVFSY